MDLVITVMVKIKNNQKNIIATLVLSFGLSSCSGLPTVSEQATALNTDCDIKDIEISDEVFDLNDDQNWTARCNGKTYRCTSHGTAGSDCIKLDE